MKQHGEKVWSQKEKLEKAVQRVSFVLQQRAEELSKLCKIMQEQTSPSVPGTIHALVLKIPCPGNPTPQPSPGKIGMDDHTRIGEVGI